MSSTRSKRRGIGYIRVSRVNGRNGDSFISPDVQRQTIKRLAAAKGVRIVRWIEDLDQSGAKYERPGFQEALGLCEAGGADAILVAKLTRFARSIPDTHKALERLEKVGAGLLCADLDVDVTTPTGRLIRGILAAIAAFELELARENWLLARKAASEKGKYPARLPLGYRRTADRRVEVDPVLGPAIAELFRGRAHGLPFTELAERFTRQTRVALHPRSIDRFLTNRAYLGELRSGEVVLPVEPIVVPSEWAAAQAAKAPRPARTKNGSLLTGILTCGSCGRPMSYRGGKGGQYTCQRFGNGERCPAPVLIAAAKIDPYVERLFLERHGDSGAAGTPADREELAAAERELELATADLEATLDLDLAAGGEALRRSIAKKEQRVAGAEERLAELRSSESLDERLENVAARWPELKVEQRQRLLAAAVERLTVHRVGPGSRASIAERTELEFVGGSAARDGAGPARA